MYLLADELLMRNGFVQYEISNWSRPGTPSTPISILANLPYLGFGAPGPMAMRTGSATQTSWRRRPISSD